MKTIINKPHFKVKFISLLIISIGVVLMGYLLTAIIMEYKDTHTFNFRSPIVIQSPVIVERNLIIINNTSTQSGMMKAYASEVKNPYNPESPKGYAWELIKNKWGIKEFDAFDQIVTHESGWNPYSKNGGSGACGIGQANPCSKMNCENWDYKCQIDWTVNYIVNHGYGTPTKAWEFWQSRQPINGEDVGNWY